MIFVFIFTIWGLLVCTVLSIKIEEQMTTQVVAVEGERFEGSNGFTYARLPENIFFYDEDGTPHVYEILDGNGWELGKRAHEIDSGAFDVNGEEVITTHVNSVFIQYTSRTISQGESVRRTPLYDGGEIEYLITGVDSLESAYRDWCESDTFAGQISVLASGDHAVLLRKNGMKPFTQKQVRESLMLSEECTVYCVDDVTSFFDNFPLIAGILAMIILSAAVWGSSWYYAGEWRKHRILLSCHMGIFAGCFLLFRQLVQKIELPSSLLPGENIFRIEHYKREFSEIFGALRDISEMYYAEIHGVYMHNVMISGVILGVGILLGLVLGACVLRHRLVRCRESNSPSMESGLTQ